MQAPKLGCTLMRERSHLEICLWVRSSCKPIHAVRTQGMQRADAGAQSALHLNQGLQPPVDLPLCVLILCRASGVEFWGLCQDLLASCVEALTWGCTQIEKHCIQACLRVYFLLYRLMTPDADRAHLYPESLICQDDGAVVMAVADDSPHGLVDCPGGLLRIPLLPGQAGSPLRLLPIPAPLA